MLLTWIFASTFAPAQAQDCVSLCSRILTCAGETAQDQLTLCATTCAATGGPDPLLASAIAAAPSCDAVIAVLGGQAPVAVAPAAAPAPPAASGRAPAPPASGGDPGLHALLTGNRWCSYSYDGGTERKAIVTFSSSGSLRIEDRSETVRTGQNVDQYGDVYQSYGAWGSGSGTTELRWRLSGSGIEISEDGVRFVPVPFRLSRNSNGYPIIQIDKYELFQC